MMDVRGRVCVCVFVRVTISDDPLTRLICKADLAVRLWFYSLQMFIF